MGDERAGRNILSGRFSLARAATVKSVALMGTTTIVKGSGGTFRPSIVRLDAQVSGFDDVPASERYYRWFYYNVTTINGASQVSGGPVYIPGDGTSTTLSVAASIIDSTAAKCRLYGVRVTWGGGRAEQSVEDRAMVTIVQDGTNGVNGANGKFIAPPVEWQPLVSYIMYTDWVPSVYMDIDGVRKYYVLIKNIGPGWVGGQYQPNAPNSSYWKPMSSIELIVIQKAWIQYLSGSEAFFDLVKALGIDTTDANGKNGLKIERNMISFIGANHPQFVMGIDADGNTIFRFFDKTSGKLKTEYNPETGLITTINANYSWTSANVKPFQGPDGIAPGSRPTKVWYYRTDNATNAPLTAYTYHVPRGVSESTVLTANPRSSLYKAPAGWYKNVPGVYVPPPTQGGAIIGFGKTIYQTFHVNEQGVEDAWSQLIEEDATGRT